MALTSGRKLCKLDAICAKLKQINNKEQKSPEETENNTDGNELVDSKTESTVDLSNKCSNNNIIGKADLNSIETDAKQNGLDLSIKVKETPYAEDKDEIGERASPSKLDRVESENVNNGYHKVQEVRSAHSKPVVGSGRRKRAIPRSIPQVNDRYDNLDKQYSNHFTNDHGTELEDAENGEKKTSGNSLSRSHDSNMNEDSNSSLLNHSRTSVKSKDSQRSRLSSDVEMNFGAPLDLSMSRSREDDDSINSYLSTDDDDHVEDNIDENSEDDDDNDFFHPDRNLVCNADKEKGLKSGSSVPAVSTSGGRHAGTEQADHLKDYAESTMNELISMYGFGGAGNHHADLAKHVPIRNFKTILQQAHKEPVSPSLVGSGSMPNTSSQMSSGDEESHDGSVMSFKGIYSNYAGHHNKSQGNNSHVI